MKMKLKYYIIGLFCTLLLGIGYFLYQPVFYSQLPISTLEFVGIAEEEKDTTHNGQDTKGIEQEDLAVEIVAQLEPQEIAVEVFDHRFQEFSQKIFTTLEEKKEFFHKLGLEYLNETVVEYTPILGMNQKSSERYLEDVHGNDILTKKYGSAIASQSLIPMSIRWLGKDIGYGIFAEIDLFPGDFIGVYGGIVDDRALIDDKDYAWAYPCQTLEGGRTTLDGAKKGNELRFINDGKDPNCVVKYILGFDGLWHVCYLALKDIKKGEQLLVSYGPAYWETRKYAYQELS